MVTKVVISCRVDAAAPEPIAPRCGWGISKVEMETKTITRKNPRHKKVPLRSLARSNAVKNDGMGEKSKKGGYLIIHIGGCVS